MIKTLSSSSVSKDIINNTLLYVSLNILNLVPLKFDNIDDIPCPGVSNNLCEYLLLIFWCSFNFSVFGILYGVSINTNLVVNVLFSLTFSSLYTLTSLLLTCDFLIVSSTSKSVVSTLDKQSYDKTFSFYNPA